MRKLLGLAVLLLLNVFLAGSVSADEGTLQVVVHADVPPARYIILSPDNQISEIISNTPLSVTPQVYVSSVANGHQRSLTPAIYTEYLFLLGHATNNKNKIGILYKAQAHNDQSNGGSQVALISDKSQNIHRLFFLRPFGSIFHA